MVFLLFCIRRILFHGNDFHMSLPLQQNIAPEFQKVKKQPINEYKGKVNVKTTISQGNTEKSKRIIDYYLSSITFKGDIEFSNNIAFGAGISTGSGGAIFTSYTALAVATNSNLKVHDNTASVGGGLCHIASAVYLEKSSIYSNNAFRFGGGIYFQGEPTLSPDIKLICNNDCNIYSNVALEYGGGICFSTAKEAHFENSKIYSNIASFAGGGIYSIDMEAINLFNTQLYENKLEIAKALSNTRKSTEINADKFDNYATGIDGLRGGGGIFVRKVSENPTYINTYKCCFHDNNAGSKAFTERNGPGHLGLFQYNIIWTSIEDVIQDQSIKAENDTELSNNPIAFVWDDVNKKPLHYKFGVTSASTESCTFDSVTLEKEINYTSAKISNTNQEYTAQVADPTRYDYVATPITKLPYPTTHFNIPQANFDKVKLDFQPNLRPVERTYAATTIPLRTLPPPNPDWKTPKQLDPNYKGKTTTEQFTTYTFSKSLMNTQHSTQTQKDGENIWIVAETEIETETIIEIVVNINQPLVGPDATPNDSDNKMLFIYIGVGVGVLLLILIIILIIFLVRKRTHDSSDDSEHEMDAEVILSLSRTSNNNSMIATENPFWATTVLSDTDDPFKKDYEENKTPDYYKIIHDKKL